MITNISSVTNAFRTDTLYGRPDFFYDPADVNTYYVPITKTRYAPLENAADDELDLGYYDFSRSDSVFSVGSFCGRNGRHSRLFPFGADI